MFMIFSVLLLGKCVWTFWLPFSVISSWRFAKVARVKWQKETLKICGDMMNQRRPPFARLWVCQRFQPKSHQRHWFGSGSCARSLHCRWVGLTQDGKIIATPETQASAGGLAQKLWNLP